MGYVCSKEIARQVRWMRTFPNQHRDLRHPGARPHSLVGGPAARKSFADRTSFLVNPRSNTTKLAAGRPEKIRQIPPGTPFIQCPPYGNALWPRWISGPPNPLFEERATGKLRNL
jgi:hypothetical protein